MTSSLTELAAFADKVRKRGVPGVEIGVRHAQSVEVQLTRRRSPRVRHHTESEAVVRVFLDDGRRGEVQGAPEGLDGLVGRALTAAGKSEAHGLAGPVGRLGATARGLGIDDRRHEHITDEDRVEIVVENERAADKAGARIRTGPFTYRDVREHRLFVNSKDVAREFHATTYEATGEVELKAPERPITLHEHIASRAFAGLSCLPYGQLLAERALGLLDECDPLDGPVRVLIPSRAGASLFGWMATLFDAATLDARKTFLARDDGSGLFHRHIHLVDDGALPGGLRTVGFDDRGVRPVPLTLIREGHVDGRFLDPVTAREVGTRPTGHVHDGRLRPTNLQLHTGTRSVNANLGEMGDALVFVVDDFPDLPEGLDLATGDLDVVVDGQVMRGQTHLGARRRVRLTGNLVDALREIPAITSDTDRHMNVDAPAFFVDGLSVKG